MNLQAIIYAVEVAKTRNYSKAAENLYVTEPTISQQIRKLEKELQMDLFLRTTRNVTLTSAGEIFMQDAIPLVEAYHSLLISMRRESRNMSRSIAIGMTAGLHPLHLSKFINQYCYEHQDVNLNSYTMTAEQFQEKLLNGNLDFAILKMTATMLDRFDKQLFQIILLRKEQFYVIMTEGMEPKGKSTVSLTDLIGIPILAGPENSMLRKQTETTFHAAGLSPVLSPIQTDDERTMLLAMEEGRGVLFAGESAAVYYKNQFRYSMLPLEPPEYNNIYLVHLHSMKLTSFDKEFIREITKYLQQETEILCCTQET